MNTRLLRHLPKEDQEHFTGMWEGSAFIREALAKMLTADVAASVDRQDKEGVLNSPNALALIARESGYRQACRDLISYLGQ